MHMFSFLNLVLLKVTLKYHHQQSTLPSSLLPTKHILLPKLGCFIMNKFYGTLPSDKSSNF